MIKTISFITDVNEPYTGVPVLIKQKIDSNDTTVLSSIITGSLNSFCRCLVYPLRIPEPLRTNVGKSLILTAAERDRAARLGVNFFICDRVNTAFAWNSLGVTGLNVIETIALARLFRKTSKMIAGYVKYDPREFKRVKCELVYRIVELLDHEIQQIGNYTGLDYRVVDDDGFKISITNREFESHIELTRTDFIIGRNLKELSDIFYDSWDPE